MSEANKNSERPGDGSGEGLGERLATLPAASHDGEAGGSASLLGSREPTVPNAGGPQAAAESGPEALIGLAYRGSDGAVTCVLCDHEMEWEHCGTCGGDGVEDAYEDDPINCSPGEEMTCRECHGRGGFYFCDISDCKTIDCRRILRAKPLLRAEERDPNTGGQPRP